MTLNALKYDETHRIYINPDHIISYSDGANEEEYVLNSLKESKDTSIFSMELFNRIRDWSSEYHFTTYRANILRPLQIREQHTVLEVGAGCGAITRYLGETGASITAVEGSLARAKCIAERCRDLANVKVICSHVDEVEFDDKFDVITLIGVFEYTAKYSKEKSPFSRALLRYKKLLKPGGSLVIAIENKLGLKYFAGFNEDHYGLPYYGLEDRYTDADITTFGKKELRDLLVKNGFDYPSFLYPFPDYKLPKTVVSDKGMNHKAFNAGDLIRFTTDRHYSPKPKANLLKEYLVWKTLASNELLPDLSNSFLIVASCSDTSDLLAPSFLGQYYTCNRHEPHNTYTSFEEGQGLEVYVRKARLSGLNSVGKEAPGIEHLAIENTTYIEGQNFHHLIAESLLNRQFHRYTDLMEQWIGLLKDSGLQKDGIYMSSSYFDALPFNIIRDQNGKLNLFDQEWRIAQNFDIPFLVVRYLLMYRRNRSIYASHFGSFRNFVNQTLKHNGLPPISSSTLAKYKEQDESVRRKINREGGLAPRQVFKSLIFLVINKLKEVKHQLITGSFAQR